MVYSDRNHGFGVMADVSVEAEKWVKEQAFCRRLGG